ncbi:DNA repair protein RecN [Alloscardovia omnicolens]|uniref:DNA repair protein RecN n=2 Tax=Alloscardovia omnicolens TaxID=419015 RepID=U1SJY4_9BIFI|nr:DNA repair protein RecN [Alloscardovia omnicolens]ERH30952.1 DNA repair protein RecN [Alloscardovia omnicolens F0580]MDK6249230.1 DNA repair protein RecN [Alloscardovia omnicolens]MDK6327969.1 DNA repair protein RecN [Alloscardovia omnicolens]MDK6444706.1 DNA repair protein RecN [Alloscardovia omnicolens]MDK6663027.1 DNA repair protein RecN [Alloscardovia omnicolens]
MLEELEIHSLGPITSAHIDVHPGMNAITGETGAGKSMLLNAVELISGAPAQASRVRPDADRAWVQAIFDVTGNNEVEEQAQSAGSDCVDNQLFINRTVPCTGRSRAVLNGHSVPRTVLSDISEQLVTIHGQSEQLKIASTSKQRDFLDTYADNIEQREEYSQAFRAYTELKSKLERVHNEQTQSIARIDYLRESIARIEEVHPQVGEDEELKARRDVIEHSAEIIAAYGTALQALEGSGDDASGQSVLDLIARATHALQSLDHIDQAAELSERLENASDELQDIVFTLSRSDTEDLNPAELDAINERIHDIDELLKRWGPDIAHVLEWKEKAQFELEDLDASPEKIAQLEEELKEAYTVSVKKAAVLTQTRTQAAEELSRTVTSELTSLAMEGSVLQISVSARNDIDAYGADNIVFEFIPFPGSPALPVGKSASGGELSRLMLALELAAFEKKHDARDSRAAGTVPTLIFDEIDAGVGGVAAAQLGQRLAVLAQGAQIIVVTHLPQVAAWADQQFVVEKEKTSDSASTTVTAVTGDDRVREIARMLAGSQSNTSLEHAQELLEQSTL